MAEEKKSTPKSVTLKKEYQHGKFIFDVEMINGDKGQSFSEKNPHDAFVVGTEAAYTMETKTKGQYTNTYLNPVKPKGGGMPKFDGKGAKRIAALNAAAMLVASGKADMKVFDLANTFNKWLNE